MPENQPKFRLHIGMRNVKTAISATLVALIYFIIDRNPTFACIGAIFGMGSDMNNSKLHGGNRLFGTIIGGVIGMLLFHIYVQFYPDGEKRYIIAPQELKVGDVIVSGPDADIKPGNALPLANIPVGTFVYAIELTPGKGAQMVRAAGLSMTDFLTTVIENS